ncbi:MAG: GTPase Era [bacterium]
MTDFRSGSITILGRPNVGKSTLLNTILGQKIAIVSTKPQTTRNRLTGIKTLPDCQMVFFDTPGIHKPLHKLGERMVRSALDTVRVVDVVLWVVEPKMPGDDIPQLRDILKTGKGAVLVINKIDTVRKESLLPVITRYAKEYVFSDIVPISAKTGDGVAILIESIKRLLPKGPPLYPEDMTTDQAERFMVSEIVREKIMLHTKEEIPFSVAVAVETWDEDAASGLIRIGANIYVERASQKGIIVGNHGAMIKRIGSEARREIEELMGSHVFLSLWVKVRKDWREDVHFLKELGFN